MLSKQLVARGVKVVTLAREIPNDLPAGIKAYICDVSDREAVRSVAKKLRKEVSWSLSSIPALTWAALFARIEGQADSRLASPRSWSTMPE